jgi:hypothetical protein
MSHLSRDERLLALDDALPHARAAHADECAACRADLDALRAVLARVRATDVPEPSPLFWDYLAARVSDAIAREPAPARAPAAWWRASRYPWAAAALAALAVMAGYLGPARRSPASAPAAVVAHVAPDVTMVPDPGGPPDPVTPDAEDGWGLIAAMADEGGAGAAAFDPQVGQSELSISTLTPEERGALVGELEAAIAADGRKG